MDSTEERANTRQQYEDAVPYNLFKCYHCGIVVPAHLCFKWSNTLGRIYQECHSSMMKDKRLIPEFHV